MTLPAWGRFLKGNFFQTFGGDEENIEGEALLLWSRRLNGGVWGHGCGKTCLIWGKQRDCLLLVPLCLSLNLKVEAGTR